MSSQGTCAPTAGNKLPFTNAYTHRVATSDRACWMCGKLTTHVLTCQDVDFFYACANHIKDPGFCRPVTQVSTGDASSAPSAVPVPSAELKPGGNYELHSRVFGMREQKYRDKQREASKAKAVASLPSVPAKTLPPKRS